MRGRASGRARATRWSAALLTAVVLALLTLWLGAEDGATEPDARSLLAGSGRGSGALVVVAGSQPAAEARLAGRADQGATVDALLAPPPDAAPEVEGRFAGRLVDESGAPVAGARVHLLPEAGTAELMGLDVAERTLLLGELEGLEGLATLAELPAVSSDATGRFELGVSLPLPSPRESSSDEQDRDILANLVVTAAGFRPAIHRCGGFAAGGNHELDDWTLSRGASLAGRVVDEAGRGLPDVPVALGGAYPDLHPCSLEKLGGFRCGGSGTPSWVREWSWGPANESFRTRTDASGAFRIDGLERAEWQRWTLCAQPEAGLPVMRELSERDLSAGQLSVLEDLVLPAGGSIAGRVVDARGAPVPDATLRLSVFRYEDVGSGAVHVELDALLDGEPLLDGIPGQASMEGALAARLLTARSGADGRFRIAGLERSTYGIYAEAEGYEPARVKDVGTGRDDVLLELRRTSSCTLRFVDPGGQTVPVDRIHVRVDAPGWSSGTSVDATTPGEFELSGLCPESRTLRASLPDGTWRSLAFDGIPWDSGHVERELLVTPRSVLEGRVLDAAGEAVEKASVKLASTEALAQVASGSSDARGRWTLRGIEPGAYRLYLSHAEHASRELEVHVEDGEAPAPLEVSLGAPTRIEVQVQDEDGQPARGWVAVVAEGEEPKAETPARRFVRGLLSRKLSRGRARVTLPEGGAYRVEYTLAKFGEAPSAVASVHVADGELARVELSKPALPRLEGRVSGLDETAYVTVVVRATDGSWSTHTRTGAEGSFALELAPDRTGPCLVQAATHGAGLGREVRTELQAGRLSRVELSFEGAPIRGAVIDGASGRPVPGVTVTLTSADGLATAAVRANEAGRFLFAASAPATAMLSAESKETLAARTPVLVGDAQAEHVLRVERRPHVQGRLLTPEGDPLPGIHWVRARARGANEVTGTEAAPGQGEDPELGAIAADGAFDLLLDGAGWYELSVVPYSSFGRDWSDDSPDNKVLARRVVRAESGLDVVLDLVVASSP